MSLRPKALCKLKPGKALAAFKEFVDTFNWMVDFCANLSGDGDAYANDQRNADLSALVDRSTSDHPVIRLVGKKTGGGSIAVVGTDGAKVEGVSSIEFKSAVDSNVEVKFSTDKEPGVTTATIGVYYV